MRRIPTALLAALLASCAPAPAPAPVVSPSATPVPASETSTVPSATPTATPATAAALTGTIYDLDGAPVEAASVHVRSLDKAVPFDQTVGATAGRYVIATLPEGVNLEVEASKPGWTTRRRVGSFTASKSTTLDFGAARPDFAGAGAPYFLSDLPEITSTDPIFDGTLTDKTKLRYSMTLSTPLDQENQLRFAQALRVVALGTEGTVTDPTASDDQIGYPLTTLAADLGRFKLRTGTIFRSIGATAATVTWNAAGTVATFGFDGPLLAGRTVDAPYLVLLEAPATPIVDTRGRQLGTGSNGSFTSWPTAGKLVPGVFQAVDPRIGAVPGLAADSREARWATTHDDARRFIMARDITPPKLTGVDVADVGLDFRIGLTFDEPLVAFDGTKDGRVGAGLASTAANLDGFSFALGQRRGDLANLTLNGKNPDILDPRTAETFGVEGDRHLEFAFDTAAVVTERAGAAKGSIFMEVDPDDARRLLITLVGRRHFFNADVTEIAVRFQGPGDPAGNVRGEEDANKQVYRGPL